MGGVVGGGVVGRGVVGGGVVGGGVVGGGFPGVRLLKPNQLRTSLACSGTVWPTPCARIAWTLGPKEARE